MGFAKYELIDKNDTSYLKCYGIWRVGTIDKIEKKLLKLKNSKNLTIDAKDIKDLDSSGALLLFLLQKNVQDRGKKAEIINLSPKHKRLLEIVKNNFIQNGKDFKTKRSFLEAVGKSVIDVINYLIDFVGFIGELFVYTLSMFKNPKNFRFKETVYFIQSAGISALPIIGMTSFLVGVVIAYQTIVQLNKFGADIFVVDASAISITRELGPMITAIVVAGRSASSFTAEIGAMKLTEEIDAMKTMGFMPFFFLVIPRVTALIISLPILIFFSDMVGIFGSMVATRAQIGLSFEIFINRLYEVLALKHYIIGIAKGPFFAIIIALIGVFHGLRVSQDTESIGKETTQSVVNAIFFVIVCDALFSIIFTELGI